MKLRCLIKEFTDGKEDKKRVFNEIFSVDKARGEELLKIRRGGKPIVKIEKSKNKESDS